MEFLITAGGGYLAVAVLALRPVSGHFAHHYRQSNNRTAHHERPNADQWFGGVLTALCVLCIWPLAVLWLLTTWSPLSVGSERKQEKTLAAKAREQEVKDRERVVAEAERVMEEEKLRLDRELDAQLKSGTLSKHLQDAVAQADALERRNYLVHGHVNG